MTENRGISHHRARSLAWSIHTDDRQLRSLIDDVLGDVTAPASPNGTHFTVRRSSEPGSVIVDQNGSKTTHAAAHAIDRLIAFLNQGVLESSTGTVDLHASAVTDPSSGLTVLTAAPSGGGKTTMAAHFCRAGWQYLSDETVGVDLDDGSLIGCGKPLTVKSGLHATLDIDLAPLTLDPAIQTRWYVRPGLLGGSVSTTAPPPTDLVFIQFDPTSATTEIKPVAPHDALMQLLQNTYRLERHRARELPVLARLVASARSWQIRTNDGNDAVQTFLATSAELPVANHDLHCQVAPDGPTSGAGPFPTPGTVFAGFAESGAVVHDHVRSQAIVLDPIGAVVWQLLDGSTSITELVHDLAQHFDADISKIESDVHALCQSLADLDFLIDKTL